MDIAWWEAAERPEAELLAVLKHVRFATMEEGFLRDTVRAWPALLSAAGQQVLSKSVAPVVSDVQPLLRLGFGPQRIYLVGGFEDGSVSTVRAYDPLLDSWCEVSSMATKRYCHAAAALNGKLYAIGGSTDDEDRALAKAEVYDPKADSWQPLPSMPTGRRSLAAVAVAGKVYTIGGINKDENNSGAVEAYDPICGAWTQVASLPMARSFHTATVVEGKIYVLGGDRVGRDDDDENETSDRVDVYDPAADSWQQIAAMPTAKVCHTASILDGKIYVTGGYDADGGGDTDCCEAYDPVTNTWTTLASLSEVRGHHASAVVNGKLCVFGGWSSEQRQTNLVEVYSPASNSWARAADLPSALDEAVAVAI